MDFTSNQMSDLYGPFDVFYPTTTKSMTHVTGNKNGAGMITLTVLQLHMDGVKQLRVKVLPKTATQNPQLPLTVWSVCLLPRISVIKSESCTITTYSNPYIEKCTENCVALTHGLQSKRETQSLCLKQI